MISVVNLSKKYNSKNGIDCLALDNVFFTLPNTGMVFITGKSGSGKSTMLNILGGIDFATSGSVIVDGNEITTYDENELENYRNTYLGFIFQEFFLIDSLTVFDNVKLALDLMNISDDERVYEILKKVGLEGYENKYPRQLSGGEKQRVAIARAVVKKPKLLLADELTGNLDIENAKLVLDILKELSKEILIVVVSHNIEDANLYADRKIELSDGKVISDVTKPKGEEVPLVEEKFINMPLYRKLDKEELELVNKLLVTKEYTIRQSHEDFMKTLEVPGEPRSQKFESSKLSFLNTLKYTFKFLRGNIANTIGTVVMFSLLIVLMFICHVFESTDVEYMTSEAKRLVNDETFILYKCDFPTNSPYYIEPGNIVSITDDEIQEFYDLGYEGNIYKAYSLSFQLSDMSSSAADNGVVYFLMRLAKFTVVLANQ